MSIVHLSSNGQNPSSFYNDFPQAIKLSPHSEVRLLGYSGITADLTMNAGRSMADFITIQTGINDSYMVMMGDLANSVSAAAKQNIPYQMKIPAGTYSLTDVATTPQFSRVMARALNDACNAQEFYAPEGVANVGFECEYDSTTGTHTITATQCRNRRSEGGLWASYYTDKGTVTSGAAASDPTKVSPSAGSAGGKLSGIFVNTRQAYLGNNGLPLAQANPSLGFTMLLEIGATTTYKDLAITHGVVPRDMLTVWDQVSNTTELWANRKPNIVKDPLQEPNSHSDWAYPTKDYGWVTFGMTVNPLDGRVGIVSSAMKVENGDLKQTENQSVDWFDAAVVPLVAGQTVRLQMSPRYDTATGEYKLVFLFDNGGGTFTILDTRSFGSFERGDNYDLMSAESIYHVCYYQPDYISPSSVNAKLLTQNKINNENAGLINPSADVTLVLQPLTADLVGVPDRLMKFAQQSREWSSGLGAELGYDWYYEESSTPTSVGWISDRPAGMQTLNTVSPLIITSPTLSVDGYIGANGGASAPILAVAPLRGNSQITGFSGTTTSSEWVRLNNGSHLTLDRMHIKLVDETNREYTGLLPDFSCWLMFRSPVEKQDYYKSKTVGGQH